MEEEIYMIIPTGSEKTIDTITVVEAAHRLKRSPASIQKAMREGTFPVGTCFSTGRQFQYIIPREAFERFLRGEIAGRVFANEGIRNV
jgi:hypothetical protein